MRRLKQKIIEKDLQNKIVFLVGPRQVGKTWLAKEISKSYSHPVYLNYDSLTDRKIMEHQNWLTSTNLLILDEIHKMPNWKNYLKGLFDTKEDHLKILVTGSARLDTFRQSGDSLAGRFFSHRLLPFSIAELKNTDYDSDLNRLIDKSGFPEPFLKNEPNFANRWRNQYIDGLIRTDILDFEEINNFKAIQIIFELLRERVGSSISLTSLAEDAHIAPNTVKKYLQIFEALYITFRITPFSKNIARSLLKEPKIYFYDTGLVKNGSGPQFENFIALSLLKHTYQQNDELGLDYDLNYLKTKEGKEVDFVLTKDNEMQTLIEVKLSDDSFSKSLVLFSEKYQVPGLQLVKDLKHERVEKNLQILKALNFLKTLEV